MNNRILSSGLAVLTCIASITGFSTASNAADFICTGTLGAVTVDNLIVPDGASCTLRQTRVNGSIQVGANSTLAARGVVVVGNVEADSATSHFHKL